MNTLTAVVAGYVIGSLPIGFVLTRWLRGIDLRSVGSGNVGATNVARVTSLGFGLLVVIIDLAKGVASVLIASRVATDAEAVTGGVAAVAGHIYPVWLHFRGGKGVATGCGVFMMLAPLATAIAAVGFVASVAVTRYVSLGSIVATAALPPLVWATRAPMPVVAGSAIAAVLIIQRHTSNVLRLASGTEHRVGQRV